MGYGRSTTPIDSLWSHINRGGFPATCVLIGINVLTFLLSWFSPRLALWLYTYGAYDSQYVFHAPWTVLTYPLVGAGFILFMVLNCVFLWFVGGSLERSWGTGRFMGVFSVFTIISALSTLGGSLLLHFDSADAGPMYPTCALSVIWCLLNAEQIFYWWGIRIRGKYLAIITPVLLYFLAGYGPLNNMFTLGGCLAAFLYVRYGRSYSYLDYGYGGRPNSKAHLRFDTAPNKRKRLPTEYMDGSADPGPLDFRGRIKAWQERKKLEKLFRQSGLDLDEEPDFNDPGSDKKR